MHETHPERTKIMRHIFYKIEMFPCNEVERERTLRFYFIVTYLLPRYMVTQPPINIV